MLFNIFEVLDIILMTAILGFLFHNVFRKPQHGDDIVKQYSRRKMVFGVEWHDFLWASALIAPSVLLHELGHKFTAMAFGADATFHAACSTAYAGSGAFLGFTCILTLVAVVLKILGIGFLFFVPGYVAIGPGPSELQFALIAFAGPFIHLVFWLASAYLLKDKKFMRRKSHKARTYLFFFKQINMLLFIFNMIPIPGFDGFSVFYNLFKALF
jgi:Zn-dependent protease